MNTLAALAKKHDGVELGYVYVMEYNFRQGSKIKTLYKVGVTQNQPIDRMLQISRSFFQSRRYVPESRLIRFRKVPDYYTLEKQLHKILKSHNYLFKTSFDGSTEFFDIELDKLLVEYEDKVPLLKKK